MNSTVGADLSEKLVIIPWVNVPLPFSHLYTTHYPITSNNLFGVVAPA